MTAVSNGNGTNSFTDDYSIENVGGYTILNPKDKRPSIFQSVTSQRGYDTATESANRTIDQLNKRRAARPNYGDISRLETRQRAAENYGSSLPQRGSYDQAREDAYRAADAWKRELQDTRPTPYTWTAPIDTLGVGPKIEFPDPSDVRPLEPSESTPVEETQNFGLSPENIEAIANLASLIQDPYGREEKEFEPFDKFMKQYGEWQSGDYMKTFP